MSLHRGVQNRHKWQNDWAIDCTSNTAHCSDRNTVCLKDLTPVTKDCYDNRFSWYTALNTTFF